MDHSPKSIALIEAATDEAKLPRRRALVLVLNLATMAFMVWGMSEVLGDRGWTLLDAAFLTLYLIGLPWTLMGFWNSVIGFVILRLSRDPVAYTNPAMRHVPAHSLITSRTAVCLAVRNEDADAAFGRLRTMIDSLLSTGEARHFDFHVLSDTDRAEVAMAEERWVAVVRKAYPHLGLHYRRRTDNAGYKAGNLEEFAKRCRQQYQHMIVLDADSVMSGRAMVRLVRAMQANPRLGILQTLVVGRPSESGFTRIFQFGMRHGMRAQTLGSAWWQGSAGPYWGHNAIIRIAPFIDHCQLPALPGRGPMGGAVLSHDQVEAALMRGAGWDVRVIADEFESWEENPTNLPDFIKRDLRWCQGNLQYLRLLTMPGLRGMGRFQLVNAIMMYAGAPTSLVMLIIGLSIVLIANGQVYSLATNIAFPLYALSMSLGFAPRFLGVLDTLLRGEAGKYGGGLRLAIGCAIDLVFSLMVGPVMMIAQTVFIGGLAFGRRMIWDAQNRADRSISPLEALHGLWPQLSFGVAALAILSVLLPPAIGWASLTILPCLLAIPFTCVTSARPFGRALTRLKLCAIPDELALPWELGGSPAKAAAHDHAQARVAVG